MKKQRKASGSLHQDCLPLYFGGDQQLFNYMSLKVQTTINLQKPHIISLPLKILTMQKQDFVEPLAQIQTFDEMSRENLLKNKSFIKQGVFYVYFPSNIRVDEKIFKIYDKNYQSFIKDIPKSFRQNFAKFIFWEQGTGQNNVNVQKQRLQDLLSYTVKMAVQRKVQILTNQIATLQGLQLNQKVLKNLFVNRNKLSSIYKQLKLPANAAEHLTNLFNDILYNFRKFLTSNSTKQIQVQKVLNKSPFIVRNINIILNYFDQKQNFLQIVNFCFMKMFEIHLDLLQTLQAMKRLKQFLDFILSNILNVVTSREEDVAKNIWIVQTIDQGLKILRSRPSPSILNTQKQQQYSLLKVSICGQYRNAIQRLGVIFYGLNTYCVFPRNLQYQLTLCIRSMHNQVLTQKLYPQLKVNNRHLEINKMSFLSGEPINDTVEMILNSFQTYKLVYVKTLEIMEKTLSQSPYKKVSWSIKLSVLKSTIIYFTVKDQKRMSINNLLEEDKIFSYALKKSVWEKLQIINKVYRLTLCKRYSIRMGVEDLLNIVLDDSIIHLQKIWRQLVKIISDLLFEYKIGETDQQTGKLNSIDYGEGEDQDNIATRRRRKTTIHYETKQIEVGTLKFISLLETLDQITQKGHQTAKSTSPIKRDTLRLSIQLSNRIISYAVALVQKSNQQRNNSKQTSDYKPLISLKFQIRTLNGQQKVIPFKIIHTQDKFIEVQIKQKEVMIFKIEKLLIDISDSITLVYTMPINHDKIQFYERNDRNFQQEQDHYMNISPELKTNTVQLSQQSREQKDILKQLKIRKQSASSTTSKPNSQCSMPNANFLIYKKLWSPLKFVFTFNHSDQIYIEKVQIQCQDNVYEKLFVGQRQVNYKQVLNFKICSSKQKGSFPLILFIRPNQKPENMKQGPNYVSATKIHMQSVNILPKSVRNRATSMARSILSGSGNSMSIDSNRVSLRLYIKHNSYEYQVSKQISYGKRSPFKVDYRYSQEFEEYTIKNLTQQQLQIASQEDSFQLYPSEEIKVFSPIVSICLNYQQEGQSQNPDDSEPNIMRVLKLDQRIDLKTMIKKQHLKPQKLSTIWLSLQDKNWQAQPQIYSIFKPIRIQSEEKGYISVLKWNIYDYQLIGKVEGMIQYTSQQNSRTLQLMLIPTKKGTISMPQISINSRKGLWKNGKTIRVG